MIFTRFIDICSIFIVWHNLFKDVKFWDMYLLRFSLLPESILLNLSCQQENLNTSIPMKHSKLKEQMVLKSSTTACCRLRFEEGPVAFHGKQSFFFPPVNPLSISVIKKKKSWKYLFYWRESEYWLQNYNSYILISVSTLWIKTHVSQIHAEYAFCLS